MNTDKGKLKNCRIYNYPVPYGPNYSSFSDTLNNQKIVGSAVNLNTLPSHVKLRIVPNNLSSNTNTGCDGNSEQQFGYSCEGYWAVRAQDFCIGSLRHTIYGFMEIGNSGAQVPEAQGNWDDGPQQFRYTIPTSSLFGTTNDPAHIDNWEATYNDNADSDIPNDNVSSMINNKGFSHSPYTVTRNSLTTDIYGDDGIGNSNPGKVYHFSGFNTGEQLMDYTNGPNVDTSDLIVSSATPGDGGSEVGPNTVESGSQMFVTSIINGLASNEDEICTDHDGNLTDLGYFGNDGWPFSGVEANWNCGAQRGYRYDTSWSYINRIMIYDSMENLGTELNDDNYPVDNEVHVIVELKNNYILSTTAIEDPEMWSLKIDLDGEAKWITTEEATIGAGGFTEG